MKSNIIINEHLINSDEPIYGYIYMIRNKINNKIYFGATSQDGGFDRRYTNNVQKYTHNKHLKRSIKKYGIESFKIVKEFDIAYSKEELDKLEDIYIKIYKTTDKRYGYNSKYGGSHGKHTNETKLKIKIANTGEGNYAYGKHQTIEHKEKIRKSNIGKHEWTDEKRKIQSEKHKGKIISEKQRKIMSKKLKGRKLSLGTKHKISRSLKKLSDKQIQEVREKYATGQYTQEQLAKEYNVDSSMISRIVNYKSQFRKNDTFIKNENEKEIILWTYMVKNGNAYIYFDEQSKYIEIQEKDLRRMIDWINIDKEKV